MSENRVEFEIIARLDSIEKSLKDVERNSEKTGKEVDKNIGKGLEDRTTRSFKAIGAAAAVAGAAIVAGLAFGLKKSIDAAIIQEEAVNDLNSALARTGQFSESASLEMQKFASELQSVTKFGDEAILQNAALIQSLGKLSTDGLKQATTAAADLSAALGIDLRSASQLVGRAASGNVDMFSRYGVVIQKGATDAETFANALRSINTQFGGAAASQANTFSGVMTQLKNAFGDLQEEIGAMITKSPALVAAIRFIKETFENLTKEVKFLAATGDPFKDILSGATSVAKFFTNILGPVTEIIVSSFKSLGIIIGGVASALFSVFEGNFKEAGNTIIDTFVEAGSVVEDAFEFSGTNAANKWLDGFQEAVNNAAPIGQVLKNNVVIPVEEASAKVTEFGTLLAGSVKNMVVSGMASIGASLVKGGAAFSDFGKTALNILGDFAIQMGGFLVASGLGIDALKTAILAFSGGLAIAAGIALIALGGALKAFASGPAGNVAGASIGQTALQPNAASPTDQLQDVEDQGPRTDVTVNIQGSVLGDKRTLGREIAEALNDAFGNDGIVIARGAVG